MHVGRNPCKPDHRRDCVYKDACRKSQVRRAHKAVNPERLVPHEVAGARNELYCRAYDKQLERGVKRSGVELSALQQHCSSDSGGNCRQAGAGVKDGVGRGEECLWLPQYVRGNVPAHPSYLQKRSSGSNKECRQQYAVIVHGQQL